MKISDFFVFIANYSRKRDKNHQLIYIIEGAGWSTDNDGLMITTKMTEARLIKARVDLTPLGYNGKIIHLGSLPVFKKINLIDGSNRVVQTIFHIDKNHTPILEELKRNLNRVEHVHTACLSTKNTLVKAGVPEKKIKVIPLGVDLKIFKPAETNEKKSIREKLNLPQDKIIIGSFQKDGNGWGEGLTPKLIKGPDIFCDAVI